MHSNSKKWVAPRVRENQDRLRLNNARRKICPNSPFWTHDFDIVRHRQEWEQELKRSFEKKVDRIFQQAAERERLQLPPTPSIKPAFGGKKFSGNYSSVLCMQTVFCPGFDSPNRQKELAPWPSKAEMKYEGDERISTDRLHGRFLGAPRVGGNETVTWMQRRLVEQYSFDDFYYPIPNVVDIFMRSHLVPDTEFTDEEGREILGTELMEMLDLKDD